MPMLLVVARDLDTLEGHYLPAVRKGGWRGDFRILRPGEASVDPEDFAGLLLTGGKDIHPSNWDPQEPLHPEADPDEERTALELPLARRAWALGLPILGICRGEQLLNVALGGSLVQDLPSACECEPELHRRGSSEDPVLCHPVTLDPDSRLGRLAGCGELPVNSRHHQAIRRLAPELRACAWHAGTPVDGEPLIEAVEARDPRRWVLGLQWHPENLVNLEGEAGRGALAIFRGFVAALEGRL